MNFEILICGSDVNAYYMARCAHEAYGIKSYMLIKDKLVFTTCSNIINHIYNPDIWNEDGFVKAVNDFCKEKKDRKVVVISSNETYGQFLVKNKNSFEDNLLFNYPNLDIFENLINKERFYKNYSNMGLYFPKTIYYKKGDNFSFDSLTFPVIVKPANVVLFNHIDFLGKKKIYKIKSMDELTETIKILNNSGYDDTVIVQEFIPGDDSHLFDSVVYCGKDGKVKFVSFAQIGLQEHNPNMVGNAAVLINGFDTFETDKNEIKESIVSFMEKIHFRGFAEFDLKYDERDGKFKVLEINARQGRCSYYIAQCGLNLVKIFVDDLVNGKCKNYGFIDNKVMLTFVNKKIIKKYIKNDKFKKEALKMYRVSVNPLVYKKDMSLKRRFYLFKRLLNYKKSYKKFKW